MRRYFFLTVECVRPESNPGSHFISDGIKELVRRADPEAILQDITLFSYRNIDWEVMLSQASGIFLCGNPRYEPSEKPFFWLTELLDHMKRAQLKGIKIGDLFLGTAVPLPVKSLQGTTEQLLSYARNRNTLKTLALFDLVITRDRLSQNICEELVEGCTLLPDSTFWAKDYYGIEPGEKRYNCVTLPSLNCTPWLLKELYKIAERLAKEKPTYFLCHSPDEYKLALAAIPNIKNLIIIYDPDALLRFYSNTDKLVSCRLHGSIPALSLGAHIVNIAMDSRAMAYAQFGFNSISYTDLKGKEIELKFDALAKKDHPSADPFVKLFTERIMI